MDKPIFSDEAYKLARVAALYWQGTPDTEFEWDQIEPKSAAEWAVEVVEACQMVLRRRATKESL